MAILHVLTDDHPTLRKKSDLIKRITPEVQKLARDMIETMRAYNGIGLAAPQVGINKRLIVLECQTNPRYPDVPSFPLYTVINPVIKPIGKDQEEGDEGCLSVPNWYGPVTRFCQVKVTGLNLEGQKINLTVDGFAARVFQHETDHLDGIIFTDYIDDPTRLRYVDPNLEDKGEE